MGLREWGYLLGMMGKMGKVGIMGILGIMGNSLHSLSSLYSPLSPLSPSSPQSPLRSKQGTALQYPHPPTAPPHYDSKQGAALQLYPSSADPAPTSNLHTFYTSLFTFHNFFVSLCDYTHLSDIWLFLKIYSRTMLGRDWLL